MIYRVRRVREHYEVYDRLGHFLFSADNQSELSEGIAELEEELACEAPLLLVV